jgi:hypothetical protein
MDPKDSLWLDHTEHSPYPKRKNGYTLINKQDKEETKKELDNEDKFTEV